MSYDSIGYQPAEDNRITSLLANIFRCQVTGSFDLPVTCLSAVDVPLFSLGHWRGGERITRHRAGARVVGVVAGPRLQEDAAESEPIQRPQGSLSRSRN